ncbi:hypothetical protein [Mesoplasma melaleucae]|uniref:hypothetical protein n=1 Tax=Mesoplasma melaleucae TaxID=81459 RepID=UPI00054DC5EC|nr:hypothetical protein [Mesoplasma melaleucae]
MLKDNKNALINIRDLIIEFRNKGKKFKLLKVFILTFTEKKFLGLLLNLDQKKQQLVELLLVYNHLKMGQLT